MTTELEALGRVVRRERKKLRLSQEGLAEACGLHRNFVGYIERAEKSATIGTLFKLADGLGTSPSRLIRLVEKASAE